MKTEITIRPTEVGGITIEYDCFGMECYFASLDLQLPVALSAALTALCHRHGVTPYMALLAWRDQRRMARKAQKPAEPPRQVQSVERIERVESRAA